MVTATPETIWEILFDMAMELIGSARERGVPVEDWSFGGGTVLMRRHRHRLSKDIDIFIGDPQFLGFLSPRLNARAESMVGGHYVEDGGFLKLFFPEGEIDFIASGTLTADPATLETVRNHPILVESSTEIVAKKVWYRGAEFTARDIFDLSMVAEREAKALDEIAPVLQSRRDVILERIVRHREALNAAFDALIVLDYRRTFDECVEIVRQALMKAE